MPDTKDQRSALHAIAIFEAIKGLAALAGLIGVLDLLHRDVRSVVLALIGRFGLDPEAHYPSLLLHYAELLPDTDVHMLVILASAYIAMRFIDEPSWMNAFIVALNAFIVGYLSHALWLRYQSTNTV